MSALGDLFVALPHMDVILDHHLNDDPWVLTGPAFPELFAHHPRIHTAVLDRRLRFGGDSTWGRILWVRRQRFAAVYDLQGNRTSRLMVRFSGAARRVGTQPHKVYTHHPEEPYTRETEQNVFTRLNETLASAGLPRPEDGARLYPAKEDADEVAEWKLSSGIRDGGYALMHAGSSSTWHSKRWPKENFLELATRIHSMGIKIVWVGAADDRGVNRYLSRHVGIDATERFSIMQLYVLGLEALFAVTNDSGPMHIFGTSGVPVFSFFGPTSWIRSHSVGQKSRVFSHETACSPCFSGSCPPSNRHSCLLSIEPGRVFSTIQSQIDFKRGRTS
jgi:heptosyltransferase I